MALVGHIREFMESQESWSQLESLSVIGYHFAFCILGNLVSPEKPSGESYENLISVISDFCNPKPLVTV